MEDILEYDDAMSNSEAYEDYKDQEIKSLNQ